MSDFFNFENKILELDKTALNGCKQQFDQIDKITDYNQQKVLHAFIKNKVSESMFCSSTGYGYSDRGRDTLDRIIADIFGCEDALIRYTFASGTHTISTALFGILRPGDKMLCVTGKPYDTLLGVIGEDRKCDGSLKDFGIEYRETGLKEDGRPDIEKVLSELKSTKYKMVYIQRSRGYSLRPSLSTEEIGEICKAVKAFDRDIIVMVDNCYGEFTGKKEPVEVGADIMAGSLIKNPGGGIAPCGGYIAGRADLIEKCAYRMTAPGVGREIGATLGHNRELYMGIFNAPHVTGEALKTAVYASRLFNDMGFLVTPAPNEKRADIIQAILLENSERLVEFCKGIQSGAPVDSYLVPEPWDMPGYEDKVVMAAGSFTLGSSIELSADAPLREPFAVWMQGGLNFHSARIGILTAAQNILNSKQQQM